VSYENTQHNSIDHGQLVNANINDVVTDKAKHEALLGFLRVYDPDLAKKIETPQNTIRECKDTIADQAIEIRALKKEIQLLKHLPSLRMCSNTIKGTGSGSNLSIYTLVV